MARQYSSCQKRQIASDKELLLTRLAAIEGNAQVLTCVSPLLEDLRNRVTELEDKLLSERAENSKLTTKLNETTCELEREKRLHDIDVSSLKESVALLTHRCEMNESHANSTLTTALRDARVANEKLSLSKSTFERKINAHELAIARNLETIASKDALINDLKEQYQEAGKAFLSKVNLIESENKTKSLEIETLRLSCFRYELRISGLEQSLEEERADKRDLQSKMKDLKDRGSEMEEQLKQTAQLRKESQGLKAFSQRILNRGHYQSA
jgi:hypothetical protein